MKRELLNNQGKLATRFEITGVFACLLVGFVLRIYRLTALSLNSDEIFTVLMAKTGVWAHLAKDIHPPLYPLIIKPFLFLGPELGPRLVSVLAGLAFCVGVWWLCRNAFGKTTAKLALFFCVISPGLIQISRMARSYSLFCALTVWMIVAFIGLRQKPGKGRWLLFVFTATAALYTFYYAAIVSAFLILTSLWTWRKDKATGRRLFWACAACGALFLPMVAQVIAQYGRVAYMTLWSVWEPGVYQIFRRVMMILVRTGPLSGLGYLGYLGGPFIGKIILLVLALLLGFFGTIGAIKRNRGEPTVGFLAGLFLFCTIGAIFAHWTIRLLIAEHYFYFLAMVTAPFTAAACLLPRKRLVVAMLIVLITAGSAVQIRSQTKPSEQLREAVSWIDERAKDHGAILTVAFFIADAYVLYGERDLAVYGLPSDLPGRPELPREADGFISYDDLPAIDELLKSRYEIFLMASHTDRGGHDRGIQVMNQMLRRNNFTLVDLWSGSGVSVAHYEKKSLPEND